MNAKRDGGASASVPLRTAFLRSQAERVGARLRVAAVAGGVTLGRRFPRGHAQACLTGGLAVVAGAAIRAAGALGAADCVDAQLVRAAVAVGAALGARVAGQQRAAA